MRPHPPLTPRSAQAGAFVRALVSLVALVAAVSLPAQDKPELSRAKTFARGWTVDDGLPHNVAHRLVQDLHGHLWIASSAGLVRFDGRTFREFPIESAQAEANYNIRDIGIDAEGTLFFLPAIGGVMQMKDGVLSEHPASTALVGRTLLTLFVEPHGGLWIVTGERDLAHWENGRLRLYSHDHDVPPPLGRFSFAIDSLGKLWIGSGDSFGSVEKGELVWSHPYAGPHLLLFPARSGGIWVSTEDRLLKWENGALSSPVKPDDWRSVSEHAIQQILEDRRGNLWVATWKKGVYCFTASGLEAVPSPTMGINTLFEDSEGNIWIGSQGGGISRVRPSPVITLDTGNAVGASLRSSLCEDDQGAIWFACRGGGLMRFFENENARFLAAESGRQPDMFLVCPDKAGRLWVATSSGLFSLRTADPQPLERFSEPVRDVRIIYCARNGDVWIVHGEGGVGFIRGGVYRACRGAEGPDSRPIRALAEDPRGAIWIATASRNLFEIVDQKLVQRVAGNSVPGGQVNGMIFDSRGSLWLATSGGLVLKQGNRFHSFTRKVGLSDEIISQLLEGGDGRLWCAIRHGFSSIALNDLYAIAEGRLDRVTEWTLGREDGLPRAFALTGSPPIPWKGREGRLWFGTHSGYVGIDPKRAVVSSTPPPVYIDEVSIDGQLAEVRAPLQLSPGEHQLVFRFSAVNFATPSKVRLRHQLIGFDRDWVDTGDDRTATYAHLAPGDYRLRVAARNEAGGWTERPNELALSVAPDWWQTWTFRGLAGLLLAGAFGGVVRYVSQKRLRAKLDHLEREHQLERERARIARDLHDELGYSVTQIGLIANRLKEDSAEPAIHAGLGELAACARRLSGELEGVVWTVSPKNNRWDRLAAYIRQFALNFFSDTAITCTVEGVEGAPDAPVAPEVQHHLLAIVKEALNNSLKHARARRVNLSLAFTDKELVLRIADDGLGFDPTALQHSERNGLTNLRERARELGGSLDICSGAGQGTTLRLTVPILTRTAV